MATFVEDHSIGDAGMRSDYAMVTVEYSRYCVGIEVTIEPMVLIHVMLEDTFVMEWVSERTSEVGVDARCSSKDLHLVELHRDLVLATECTNGWDVRITGRSCNLESASVSVRWVAEESFE